MLGTEQHTRIKSTEQEALRVVQRVWFSPRVCYYDFSKAGILSRSCSLIGVVGSPLFSFSAALL